MIFLHRDLLVFLGAGLEEIPQNLQGDKEGSEIEKVETDRELGTRRGHLRY